MPKVNVSLDADLVVEVMVLSGVNNPQDAVEVVLRDYVAHGHRTEAIIGKADEARRNRDLDLGFRGPETG
jgi:Arc/MetJ family transcription regulator